MANMINRILALIISSTAGIRLGNITLWTNDHMSITGVNIVVCVKNRIRSNKSSICFFCNDANLPVDPFQYSTRETPAGSPDTTGNKGYKLPVLSRIATFYVWKCLNRVYVKCGKVIVRWPWHRPIHAMIHWKINCYIVLWNLVEIIY